MSLCATGVPAVEKGSFVLSLASFAPAEQTRPLTKILILESLGCYVWTTDRVSPSPNALAIKPLRHALSPLTSLRPRSQDRSTKSLLIFPNLGKRSQPYQDIILFVPSAPAVAFQLGERYEL